MSESDEERFRAWVAGVLGLMAESAEAQLDYLSRHGIGPDEIALQFDDMRNVIAAKVDSGAIDPSALEVLEPVVAQLDRMTQAGPGVWGRSSLLGDPEWQDLRGISSDCLVRMNEVLEREV